MEETGRRAFEVMGRLNFVRESGTEAELEAAELICGEIRKSGCSPVIEAFQMNHSVIERAALSYNGKTVEAGGFLLSGSTDKEGLKAPFLYAQNGTETDLFYAKGKIILLNRRLTPEVYRRVIASGALGFITFSGTIIDDRETTDLPDCALDQWAREIGVIPGVHIRAADALELVRESPAEITMTLLQKEQAVEAHNVTVNLPGTQADGRTILLGGHYDTAQFSPGVYDNGAGSGILIELLEYFKANPAKHNLRFVWFTAEERGLFGSKAYTAMHEKELEGISLMVNVDLAAPLLGSDHANVMAHEGLCHYIDYMAKEAGFPIEVEQAIYSSDSIPFADKGVPAVNFFRAGAEGGVKIHHRNDDMHQVGFENLQRTTVFVRSFCRHMADAAVFPVPAAVPKKITDAIDVYLKRKTKEEIQKN